jgi:hypothetical protein
MVQSYMVRRPAHRPAHPAVCWLLPGFLVAAAGGYRARRRGRYHGRPKTRRNQKLRNEIGRFVSSAVIERCIVRAPSPEPSAHSAPRSPCIASVVWLG